MRSRQSVVDQRRLASDGDVAQIWLGGLRAEIRERHAFDVDPVPGLVTLFRPMRTLPTLVLLALVAVSAGAQTPQPADLIVTNARIYTVDPSRPMVDAMVVRGGRVVFTGPARLALTYRGASTRVLDLAGKTVIPGMIDSHVHLLNLGNALRNVDLRVTRSYDEVIARVVARVKETPAGQWITGRAWDQNDWADTRFPTKRSSR
jgi:hypothetical protein